MARQPSLVANGKLETPFLAARQFRTDVLDAARHQARTWRLFGLLALVIAGGAVGGLIYQSRKAQVVPYVVEVDTQGQVRTVGLLPVAYNPSQAAIQVVLQRFVESIRGVPTDPVLLGKGWSWAFAHATDQGQQRLRYFAEEHQIEEKVGHTIIEVKVDRVLPLTETSSQVQWTETVWDQREKRESAWSGLFTVVVQQPKTADALQVNPLGIYIDTFSWAKAEH